MLPTVKKYDSELYFTSHSNLNYLLVHGVYPQFRNFSLTQIHVTCNSNDTKWGLIFHGLTRIPGNTLRSGRQNGGIYQCLGDVMGNRLGSQIELINITWYCSAFLQRTGNNRDKLEGKIRFVENKKKKEKKTLKNSTDEQSQQWRKIQRRFYHRRSRINDFQWFISHIFLQQRTNFAQDVDKLERATRRW